MANNPVQIVLNSQHYVQHVEVNPGGSNTDFYAGDDAAFSTHKAELANAILALRPFSNQETLVYAHVELQEKAWAKSHRPNRVMFPTGKIRTISGNELGTVIVELNSADLDALQKKVLSAEEETTWIFDEDKNRKIAKPTRLRSEVGAIKKIRVYVVS
jgi:hypothetical protein